MSQKLVTLDKIEVLWNAIKQYYGTNETIITNKKVEADSIDDLTEEDFENCDTLDVFY